MNTLFLALILTGGGRIFCSASIAGFLSFVGAIAIVIGVVKDKQKRRQIYNQVRNSD
jgi:hypothetical protein